MLTSTLVFQVGLVAMLLQRFRALLILSALYLTFSVILHSWLVVRVACPPDELLGTAQCVKNTFSWHYSQNLRLFDTTRFIWTDGLQVIFVLQRTGKVKVRCEIFAPSSFWGGPACFVFAASVLYYYWYKRTSEYLGDPRLYEDSPWLREAYTQVRQ